jgi:hypothetical protein
MPGVVLIRQALAMEEQLWVARCLFEYGHGEKKWWTECPGKTAHDTAERFELNNQRQGRGRIYDYLSSYLGSSSLRALCRAGAAAARAVDDNMPDIDPTHLLTMYYTTNRKLGWHRDDGSQDGQSSAPVVSVSVGDACDFLFKDERGGAAPVEHLVRLESGDMLLFGGPARHMLHTVSTVHSGTCPAPLQALHEQTAALAPSPAFRRRPPSSFRANLTFRHAPELSGRESEERFFYFARSARTFLAASREQGVEEARRRSVERRREKARVRAEKKQKKAAAAV